MSSRGAIAWGSYAYALLLLGAVAGLVIAAATLRGSRSILEYAALLSGSAGALCVLAGVGFAWLEWQAAAKAKDAAERASEFRPLEGGVSVGEMADLAKALKGLAQSIQTFFVAALFFLIAGALALGGELVK